MRIGDAFITCIPALLRAETIPFHSSCKKRITTLQKSGASSYASLIGVPSLIHNAKGNPFVQAAGREYENIPCRMTEDEKAHYITPRKPLPMISVVLVMRVKECGSTSRAYWRRRMA